MEIVVFTDGLCAPTNPNGYACWAWVAENPRGELLANDYGFLGYGPGMTCNIAEYHGVIAALRWMQKEGHRGLLLQTDSDLVVRQVNGDWKCKKQTLRELCNQAQPILKEVEARLKWVPREENERADFYTRVAYDKARAGLLKAQYPRNPDLFVR